MAHISHHIHKLKQQPSHIRERVAIGISGGVTAMVAIGWMMAMSSSGAFSLATSSIAESIAPPQEVKDGFAQSGNSFNSLMGAAGQAFGTSEAPADIQVVDTHTSSTLDTSTAGSATVIPF
jgi:hypothetical protein